MHSDGNCVSGTSASRTNIFEGDRRPIGEFSEMGQRVKQQPGCPPVHVADIIILLR